MRLAKAALAGGRGDGARALVERVAAAATDGEGCVHLRAEAMCHVADARFLVPETIAFCSENNPLFLARPEWMVKATCASAYCLLPGYALIVYAAATRSWERMRVPILLFVGAKLYAIAFYHFMEFTSATPPPHPAAYFAVEGPYLFSIALVLMRIGGSTSKPKRA